jgi:hypothetical protein
VALLSAIAPWATWVTSVVIWSAVWEKGKELFRRYP